MRWILILALTGCSFAKEDKSPREYDCKAICEKCERCEINCETVGIGIDTTELESVK